MKGVHASCVRGSITAMIAALGLAFLLAPGVATAAPPVPQPGPATPTPQVPKPVVPTPAPAVTTQHDTDLLRLPETRPIRGMGWPALSPDGKMLCFTYQGNLWTVPAAGGTATRLTVHEALDASPHWSPDSRWIAFTSTRFGNPDIFLIPAEGGDARQVTYSSGSDWVNEWSPDGQKLLFYSNTRDTREFALFTIDLRTRALKRLTSDDDEPVRFGSWSANGKLIAYTRSGEPWWRPWYRGSVASDTVVEDLESGKVHTVLKTNTQQIWPLFAHDGRSLYITTIYGSSNTPNLYEVPVDGGTPRAITRYTTDAVRFPSIARDGSLLTYLYNGDLYTVHPDGTDAHKVNILARSDDKVNNQRRETLHDGAVESELSPDGKTLALVISGNIWTVPVEGGDAVRLTNNPANNNDINWSPDGSKLVFISDLDNQPDVYTIDVKSKAITRVTNDPATESNPSYSPDGAVISYIKSGLHPGLYVIPVDHSQPERRLVPGENGVVMHIWSPDSKWIAFSRSDRYNVVDIWLVPSVGGTPIDVTRYPDLNLMPEFTKDGKNLLFISDRNGPPALFRLSLQKASGDAGKQGANGKVKVDFDEIDQRAVEIPLPAPPDDFALTPDSEHIVVHAANNFWGASIGGGPVIPLTSRGEPGSRIEFVPNGSRFYYIGAGGTPRSLGVPSGGQPAVVPFTADLLFDHKVLIQQAFNEFYRQFGSSFYDGTLNGVDWPALRRKYEPLLDGVGTPWEFATILQEMVGEVNSSHSEIVSADRPFGPRTPTLGIDYDYGFTGSGLRVAGVMPNGPADQPDARIYPGDYVLSVDGTDVSMTEDYYLTLQDKEGKEVTLLVNNRPTKDGARTVKVKPISPVAWFELEYQAMVKHRRELVDKLSGGKLAYIHIQEMNIPSLLKFRRDLYTEAVRKEGLILDIRGNGGGNTHDEILQALAQHVYGYSQERDRLRETQPARAFTHPVVLLINQKSYSDAEIFPAAFRDMKLGKVIGMTTPGYVIGTRESRLVDGTNIRLPEVGFYTLKGKNLENLGIQPDILVENTPESVAAGHDRQLEVAVQTLLKELPTTPDKIVDDDSVTVFSSANTNPNGGSSAGYHSVQPSRSGKP